ncbi:hypothetical protein [Mastigocoleus testarum]|nr:hypothetical protein [Mastigocoleus testarum]
MLDILVVEVTIKMLVTDILKNMPKSGKLYEAIDKEIAIAALKP